MGWHGRRTDSVTDQTESLIYGTAAAGLAIGVSLAGSSASAHVDLHAIAGRSLYAGSGPRLPRELTRSLERGAPWTRPPRPILDVRGELGGAAPWRQNSILAIRSMR